MKSYLYLLLLVTSFVHGQAAAQWSTCIGSIYEDEIQEIKKTSDGGSIVVGTGGNTTGSPRCMVAKLDSYGTIEWQRVYGSTWLPDRAYSITEASDGGYVFTGFCAANGGDVTGNHGENDIWVVKLNLSGAIVWQKSLGGTSYDWGKSIKTTSDGGYIVAGYSYSNDGDVTGNHGGQDLWIIKLNATGNILWQKSLGGSAADYAYSIQQTTDGGYIVSGNTGSNDGDVTNQIGNGDFWIVKLNDTGTIQWQKTFGGVEGDFNPTTIQTTDGGYIVAGTSVSHINTYYIRKGLIIKLNNLGNVEWQRLIGHDGAFNYGTNITSIIQTLDGGYATVGTSIDGATNTNPTVNRGGDDIWFLKLDASGNIEGQRTYGSSGNDIGTSIQQLPSGEYLIAGHASQTSYEASCNHLSSRYDGVVIKLNSNPLEIEESFIEKPFTIYPNPSSGKINVKVNPSLLNLPYVIFEQSGRILDKGIIDSETKNIDISNFSNGIYIFSLGNDAKYNSKIIKN